MHTALAGRLKGRDQLGDKSIDDSATVIRSPILKKYGVRFQTRWEWAKIVLGKTRAMVIFRVQ